LQDYEISDDRVSFTCGGKTSVIDDFTFYDSTFDEIPLGGFIERVLDNLGFDSWIEPALYDSPPITAYTGNIGYRAVLALLSDVSSCLAFENIENVIQFRDILTDGTAVQVLDYENILEQPRVRRERYYNGITLTEYTVSTEAGQLAEVRRYVDSSAEIMIPFERPRQGTPSCSVSSGFALTNVVFHTMYMTATLTGSGTAVIVVTGTRANLNGSQVFYPAPWHDPFEPDYPYAVDLPMMIDTPGFPAFRDWFLSRKMALLNKRLSCEAAWLGNPALQIGNVTRLQVNNKLSMLNMITVQSTVNFNGGILRGCVKLIGDSPW